MAQYEIATGYLNGLLQEWDSARKPQELTMLDCYQDDMRIARTGDTTGTGVSRTQTSKPLFMGVTRSKIRSATAKINDSLFGNGKMPFDIEATNPELEPYSDTVYTIVNGQLEAMDYRDLLSSKVYATARYGTAWTFGPFVRKAKKSVTTVDNSQGFAQIVQMEHEYDEPYFELGNTLDCYPDPSARTMKAAQGIFWVSMFSPAQVLALKNDASYTNIDEAARIPDQSGTDNGSDMAQQLRGNLDYWYKDGRVKFVRYFGKIPANKIDTLVNDDVAEVENETELSATQSQSDEMIDVIVIMAGGYVIKVTKLDDDVNPVAIRQCWENALDEMWGIGIAENNFAMQRVTNAAFRMFTESKGLALNPMYAVDRSKFLLSEDFKRYPGKVFQFKPGLTPDEKTSAIIPMLVPDVSTGWMDLIDKAGQFSDDDTGITKYTQGDDSSHLNKTASGISMIMSASSLPLKEIVEHCDMTIEAHIESLIDWNLTFMEPQTVEILYGKEHAARWAQIKQLGKASFIDFKATGTSSFMAKEVLTSKLQAYLTMAMSNPAMAQLVDVPEMMKQVWEAMEVGRKLPIIEQDKEGDLPPELMQKMQESEQMIAQMGEVIEKMQGELDDKQTKEQAEMQKAANEAMRIENDRYQKETERMRLEYEMKRYDLSDSEKVQADMDFEKVKIDMAQDHAVEMAALQDAFRKGLVPAMLESQSAIASVVDANDDSQNEEMMED
jgi:hypothetical protein